jgi:hypothetical protein
MRNGRVKDYKGRVTVAQSRLGPTKVGYSAYFEFAQDSGRGAREEHYSVYLDYDPEEFVGYVKVLDSYAGGPFVAYPHPDSEEYPSRARFGTAVRDLLSGEIPARGADHSSASKSELREIAWELGVEYLEETGGFPPNDWDVPDAVVEGLARNLGYEPDSVEWDRFEEVWSDTVRELQRSK